MIEKLKQLFQRDKSVEHELIAIVKQQHDFIAHNINERVVYVDKDTGYSNADRFADDPNAEDKVVEDNFDQDMTPDMLREEFEGPQEGEKTNI